MQCHHQSAKPPIAIVEGVQGLELVMGGCYPNDCWDCAGLTNPLIPGTKSIEQPVISRWWDKACGGDASISDPNEDLSGSDSAGVGAVAGCSVQEFSLQVFEHPDGDRLSLGDQLVGALRGDDEPAAIAELVRRYLTAFGPATLADISQFTILKRSALREVVESMPDVLPVAASDGSQLLDVSGRTPQPGAETAVLPPRLLGMWDSVLLAYSDRSRVIPDEHRPHVIRRNGDVLPTVVVGGLVRGVWRATTDAIEIRALESIDDATLNALNVEARDLRRLLADREPAVFARFGSWWDRLPDGPTITIGT